MHVLDDTASKTPHQIADILDGNVTSDLWTSVANTWAVDDVVVTKLDGTTATFTLSTGRPAKWKGSSATDPIPQAATLIKASTNLRGPSYRGRMYLPALGEGIQSGGLLGSIVVGSMTTGWTDFLTAMQGDDCPPVVASYKHSSSALIESYLCENESATQRRRQSRNR
jgi:hypothetical protein